MAEKPAARGLTVPKNPAAMLRALNTRHAETNDPDNKETDQQTNNTTILQTEGAAMGPMAPPAALLEETEAAEEAAAPSEIETNQQRNKPSNRQSIKPTKKQTNNTTETVSPPTTRRDGRTLRSRQPVSDPASTIVTSFRISVGTMEALDRFCFENRIRKQDVVEQALAAYMADSEDEE